MAIGPGKHDDLATYVREQTGALGAIVIVLDGNRGTGFSQQIGAASAAEAADRLREVAGYMRRVATAMEADAERFAATTRDS